MRLFVVRHGQSDVNVGNWKTLPTMDTSLTAKGRQQAEALHHWLITHEITTDALYASSMRRTRETASYVESAFGMKAIIDDRIREIGNSGLDGRALPENMLPREFNRDKPDIAPFANRGVDVEEGESWMHFRTRLGQFVDDLIKKHHKQTVYVVAHGGVVSAMFDNIFNVGPYRNARTYIHNTAWSQFEYQPYYNRETWQVRFHNRIDHLITGDLL